jgi:UDP-glucose 4-epimerase
VTGGAGFIGSHLVDALVGSGRDVVVVDDLSSGSPSNLPADVRLIRADIADPATIGLIASERPALVIHAAAQVSVPRSMSDPARDRAVNLLGTEHVIEGARRARAARFVFVSSGGAVYGEAELATEDDAPAPASYYGVHKLAAEGYVRISGLSHGVARLPNVYGPRQRSDLEGGVVAIFGEALRDARPVTIFGSGDQVRDFLYVEDAVAGILAIAGAIADGTWNVSTGQQTSVRALLGELEALTGRRAALRHEPARSGDVISSCLSSARIRTELGWVPRFSLRDGLAATANA